MNYIPQDGTVSPSLPRIVSRQAHRNNTPAATPEEYFRPTVGISLLDTIIMEMETRFNPFIVKSSKLLFLVPSIILNDDIPFDEEGLREILEFYSSDIPEPFFIEQELRLWKGKWDLVKEDERPGNLANTLKLVCFNKNRCNASANKLRMRTIFLGHAKTENMA